MKEFQSVRDFNISNIKKSCKTTNTVKISQFFDNIDDSITDFECNDIIKAIDTVNIQINNNKNINKKRLEQKFEHKKNKKIVNLLLKNEDVKYKNNIVDLKLLIDDTKIPYLTISIPSEMDINPKKSEYKIKHINTDKSNLILIPSKNNKKYEREYIYAKSKFTPFTDNIDTYISNDFTMMITEKNQISTFHKENYQINMDLNVKDLKNTCVTINDKVKNKKIKIEAYRIGDDYFECKKIKVIHNTLKKLSNNKKSKFTIQYSKDSPIVVKLNKNDTYSAYLAPLNMENIEYRNNDAL
ncbi:MAG: hypothetical protein WC934_02905 [Acidithiobacillus sp.]|jgi:hypothetical protein|uniref:hypothetical protein n=1 Tax=Acidithiobacillus sp. TaxID=1872118 RepID=UPI00355E3CAA